jgi:hypothetical protein
VIHRRLNGGVQGLKVGSHEFGDQILSRVGASHREDFL